MNDQERAAKDRKIEAILSDTLGRFYDWQKPQLIYSIGPVFTDVFDQITKQIVTVTYKLKTFLSTMDAEIFEEYFGEDGEFLIFPPSDNSGWSRLYLSELCCLNKKMPIWFASGFGVEEYSAEIDYWDKFELLKSRELLLLSVGIDPRKTDLQKMLDVGRKSNSTQPLVSFLEDRYKLLARKFNPQNFPEWSVTQEEFFKWANAVNFDVYEPFLERLRHIHQPKKQKEEIDPREKTSLLQMVYLMAMDGYGFDPKTKRSDIPKILSDCAELNEIQISRDTIRNHLNASKQFQKDDWKTE